MKTYLSIGTAPVDEDCIQVNKEKPYLDLMKLEALRYILLLKKLFPLCKEKFCSFAIRYEQHDFGTYLEVVVIYHSDIAESEEYAYEIEGNLPKKWND